MLDTKKTERHIASLFTEAQKLWPDLGQHLIDAAYWEASHPDEALPDWIMDAEITHISPMAEVLDAIHISTICLLDAYKLHEYLRFFFKKFGKTLRSRNAATDFQIDEYWTNEPYNLFLRDIANFLAPLNILDDDSRFLTLSGIKYLETILKNTAKILHQNKIIPRSETEVYKGVRTVVEAVFPSTVGAKSNFLKTTNAYKPDILIPELYCAIEYKYAEDEQKLISTIAQISDDVKGYTKDDDYHVFYAVFYVSSDFWGIEKFKRAWQEKDFPQNWKAYYIVGNSKAKA